MWTKKYVCIGGSEIPLEKNEIKNYLFLKWDEFILIITLP